MARPSPLNFDLDDAIRRYTAGETIDKVAAALGVSQTTVYRKLNAAGVIRRRGERLPIDLNTAIRRYEAGESCQAIADTFGVSGQAIYDRLSKAGVIRRKDSSWVEEAVRLHLDGLTQAEIGQRVGRHQATVSEALLSRGHRTDSSSAMRKRMARMTAEERAVITTAAHDAIRGSTVPLDALEKRATTKEVRRSHATPEELAVAALIPDSVPQKAIGKYNIDIGCEPVAVELFGGSWHADGRHRARLPQRVEHIADRGWNLLIVWSTLGRLLNVAKVAQDALAFLELSRRDPAFRRQYRVIWGDGQVVAAGCVDDGERTLIPPGVSRYDRAAR